MELVKITVLNPQDVPKIREIIEQEGMETFESDIMFKYRFMVDHKLKGMQWIDVNATRSLATTVKIPGYYANSLEPTEKIENASLKTMAVDIECLLTDSTKPMDSKRDPIIMIAMAFEPEFKGKKTLVLTAKPTKEADTLGFQDEREMLSEYAEMKNITMPSTRACIVDNKQVTLMLTDDKEVHPSYDLAIWMNSPYFAKSLTSALN